MTLARANAACFCVLDGERCAQTIKSVFENAKNPDKVIVGLIEEAEPNDILCLEQYCLENGKFWHCSSLFS